MTDIWEGGVLTAKIITALTLFVVSVIFGVVPFKLAQIFKWSEPIDPSNPGNNKSSKIVSVLLCFGGGVLLATTFLHLLPDINDQILILKNDETIPELYISLGELFMMCGFFLIYLIEEIVHHFLHRYQEKRKQMQTSVETMKPEEETYAEAFMRDLSSRNSIHRRFSDALAVIPVSNSRRGSVMTENHHGSKALPAVIENGKELQNGHKNHVNERDHSHKHHGHGHSHAALPIPHSEEEDTLVSSIRGLLIVLALSIHELFEGFAVGLQKTSYGVYYMFAAVAAHKFVISFCIGVELMVQRTKVWLAFIYVFVYSVVSALGILVGAALTTGSLGDKLQVPNIVLQGLATGTLLYVIFFEVLSKDRSGIIPYLSIFCGFVLMAGLQFVADYTEKRGISIVESTTPSMAEFDKIVDERYLTSIQ